VHWIGDATGHLLVEHPERHEYRDPWGLIAYAAQNASRFREAELLTLGALTLFMAIREVPPTTRGVQVLVAADRGIDSLGPVHPAFYAGVSSLKERLLSQRLDDQPAFRAAAFQFVRPALEAHGWSDPAA
jgi:hypothetical protein